MFHSIQIAPAQVTQQVFFPKVKVNGGGGVNLVPQSHSSDTKKSRYETLSLCVTNLIQSKAVQIKNG